MRRMVLMIGVVGAFTAVAALILLKPAAEVRGKTTAVPIAAQMTPEQQTAQDLALADARVQAFTSGHRAEVFGVSRVVLGPYPESLAACATSDCRQVEIYLWDTDTAVTAFVRLDTAEVLDVMRQPHLRPGINKRLHDLSLEIATNAPEVIAALGFKPSGGKVLAAVDAGLLDTACGGEHLCVAPTFAAGDGRILWAVVDLTAEELAGIYWTEAPPVGEFEPFVPTDCGVAQSVSRDGWSLSYVTTNNDGLNVYNVSYNGTPVITSIKLVEWHADYGSSGYQDSTGCSSGGGGFTIYPYGNTQVLDLLDGQSNVIGFEVVQDFRMSSWGNTCNYRYEQRIRFYADGSFRPVSAAYGKGCGTNSLYRPVLRINIAVDGDENDLFSRWDGVAWQAMTTEDYLVPYAETGHGPHHIDPNGYSWKVEDTVSGMGYYIVQDVGQFPNGEGDNPFLYPVLHHANEGDTDLYVFSSGCCNDNHQQGPHLYLNGESINSENIVLWYVPQAMTDATAPDYYCWTISGEPNPVTYPCFMGPLFVPMAPAAPTAGFSHNGPLVLGSTAVFVNTSTGDPITYTWNFGDGSPLSDLENPMHDYASVGDYTVTLTATNDVGSDSYADVVRVGIAPTAVFTHPTSASAQSPVPFTNQSQGTPALSYAWDFGDGTPIITLENPAHIFADAGAYTVTLTVNSPFGTDSASSVIVIDAAPVPPTAAFTATLTLLVNQPVSFTNLTVGTPPITYTWDFGDGSPLSDLENPTHTYVSVGDYTVTLTATNEFGSDTAVDVVRVGLAPTAVFTHPITASAQAPVPFTNQSQGTPPLSYVWDFGDGSPVVTVENPAHVYADPGTYTVTLAVSSPFGSDVATSAIIIDDAPVPPTAAFTATTTAVVNQPVSFTNLTVGTPPISYTWDFGDGSPPVSEVSPTHTFTVTGSYTVTLTATNAVGSDTAVQVIQIEPGIAPTAVFTYSQLTLVNLPISFTNMTTGTLPISYTWDFGDGSPTVTDIHPSHTFTMTGLYTVTLKASNEFGDDTAVLIIHIIERHAIYLPIIFKEE